MSSKQERTYKRKLHTSYLTTIVSITLVLFMLGMLGYLILNAKKVSDHVKENIGLSIIMTDGVKESDIVKLQKYLDRQQYIKETEYISKEDAAQSLQEDLGEDFISFLGYNPLEPSIEARVKADWANSDSLSLIKKQLLEAHSNIKEIQYQETLVQSINDNITKISLIIIGFSFLLLITALALINNTIRLSVYSRRFIIRSMQLVGATESFIRKPFIHIGIGQGFISAVIADFLIWGMLWIGQKEIPELFNLQEIETIGILFFLVMVAGVVITWISNYFAVRKYLRINIDNLYI
ncbi:MAG: permease-like cell division protein FtsX [Bacteroidales bacterium]|nr:permease-like cell division protein FtsX [Bacteroidales bacterium]